MVGPPMPGTEIARASRSAGVGPARAAPAACSGAPSATLIDELLHQIGDPAGSPL